MKLYWYWPFTREENFPLAEQVGARLGVDELVVSTIDRPGAWHAGDGPGISIRHDLPDVRAAKSRAAWAIDRSVTYVGRIRARRRAARAVEPDLVHVWYPNPWTDVVDLRGLQRRWPIVLHVHDVWPHERRLPVGMTRAVLKSLYAAPAALVVYHESLRARLVEDFGVPARRIDVVPMMVPPVSSTPTASPSHRRLSILFFGTFRPNKGLDVLIRVIEGTAPAAGVRWTIAGHGDARLEEMVRRVAAARDDVDARIGWKTAAEKTDLYHSADLVVLPYTSFASQSAVLHDAYGHGVPVVVSDVGALGDAVRTDGTGWVVPSGNEADLGAAILRAIEMPDVRASYSTAALAAARERSPERVAAALIEVYDRVLGRSRSVSGRVRCRPSTRGPCR